LLSGQAKRSLENKSPDQTGKMDTWSSFAGNCGQVIGIEGGTQADLEAKQLQEMGAEFYEALRLALYHGESEPIGSRRSGRVLSQDVHDAIGYIAIEFPNSGPKTVDKAVDAYNACVSWLTH
jgi:hypothetical protein